MEKPEPSSAEVERLKNENATLRKRIRTLEDELRRLQARVVSTWGEA